MPTRSTIHRRRGILLIAGLLAGSAGLAACGTSGEGSSAPPPPPPPPAIEDVTEDDVPAPEDTTTTEAVETDDDDGRSYPEDATSVEMTELIDLCELFPLEMAQEILPTLASPATDPDDPHDPVDYWCSWANPTPAHPEDTDSFQLPLRGAGISVSGSSYYTDRDFPLEGDPPEVIELDVDGADYYFGYTSDGGLAIYVQVLSSDEKKFTGFYFGAGENICKAPYGPEDCVVDPASDNPEIRAALVDKANEMAEVVQPLLDDYEA